MSGKGNRCKKSERDKIIYSYFSSNMSPKVSLILHQFS